MMPDVALTIKTLVLATPSTKALEILQKSIDGGFPSANLLSLGMEPVSKYHLINNQQVCFSLWVISGSGALNGMQSMYFMGAMALVMMYRTDDRQSFEQLPQWHDSVQNYSPDIPVALVAVHDAGLDQEITREEALTLVKQLNGFLYLEIGREEPDKLEVLFSKLGKMVDLINREGIKSYTTSIQTNGIIKLF